MIRKSRFSFLFESDGAFFVYNSASNSLLKIDRDTYITVNTLSVDCTGNITWLPHDTVEELSSLHIIATEEEDNEVADAIRVKNLVSSLSTDTLGLTIAPTLSYNLCCPYCFESNKPAGIMSFETCDKVIEFIKRHNKAKFLYVTWFGGEPLLCPDRIEYLLVKMKDLDSPKLVNQSIVTNATLLTPENWKIFRDYRFDSVQVTLDGEKSTHDSKRFFKDGSGTYSKILDNLVSFAKEFPDVELSVRVNVDKNNSDEFVAVFKSMLEIFSSKDNVSVYPGIIKDCGAKSSDTVFLNNSDIQKLIEKHTAEGIKLKFPQHRWTGCSASCLYSYVIGPHGELYKCWEDIGNEKRVIGNVSSTRYTNPALFNKYILYGSHYSSSECMKCPVLPICTKDCPHDRLSNIFEGADKELCCIYKNGDGEFINWLMKKYYKSFKKD